MMFLMERRSLLRKNPVYKVSESLEQVTANTLRKKKFLLKPKNLLLLFARIIKFHKVNYECETMLWSKS